jgi:hypothetical protein
MLPSRNCNFHRPLGFQPGIFPAPLLLEAIKTKNQLEVEGAFDLLTLFQAHTQIGLDYLTLKLNFTG